MEVKFNRIKGLFRANTTDCDTTEPQIGFKVSYEEPTKLLKVKVIGARQLPTTYGNIKPKGYLVKVTVFPEKEKFETAPVKESWPSFNEEFTFTLNSGSRRPRTDELFKAKFVSFTVYAVLDDADGPKGPKPKSTLKRFFSFSDYDEWRTAATKTSNRRSCRNPLSSRRTVGAATYMLDLKNFSQKMRPDWICTPDIWRGVQEITSGMRTESRDGKKGSVEMTLSYAISEDGRNDTVEVSVTKFRCSLQTMQEHERAGGQLHIKITAFECDDLIQKMKSDKFDPTISLKLEAKTATLRANVNNYNIEQVKILIRLISTNLIGKKDVLGKIEIDRYSPLWKEIVRSPNVPITRMINFE